MQGNGQQAVAGKGHEDHLGGIGAADGGLQAAAVPMLPAMEVAEEPEKAPGGKSKDPNTYKVLSLVRVGVPWGPAAFLGARLAGGACEAARLRAGVSPRGAGNGQVSARPVGDGREARGGAVRVSRGTVTPVLGRLGSSGSLERPGRGAAARTLLPSAGVCSGWRRGACACYR